MKRTHSVCLGLLLAGVASGGAAAQSFEADVAPLVETSCMTCHGARTATPLDITSLGQDLTDRATFRAWERIYERVENGEMPPRGVRRPDAAVVDLTGPRAVEFTPYLRPGDLIGLSVADLDVPPEAASFLALDDPSKGYGGMKDYPGEGIAFRSLTIDGPLLKSDAWPPARTRQLLVGVEFDDFGGVRLTKAPYEHVVDIVARFAPRAFRRPLEDGELEAYASLAEPLLAEGRPFIEAVRVPLRAILSAPAFLYQMGDAGPLDLQARGDASGSLLDRTTILFGSNLGNANAHTPVDLPILVAGADFAHGKHVVHEGVQNAPLCNLFVTLLQGMGVETEEFGQSTGTLTWS